MKANGHLSINEEMRLLYGSDPILFSRSLNAGMFATFRNNLSQYASMAMLTILQGLFYGHVPYNTQLIKL